MCPQPVLLSAATFVDKVRQVSFTAGSGDKDRKKKGDEKNVLWQHCFFKHYSLKFVRKQDVIWEFFLPQILHEGTGIGCKQCSAVSL